MKARQKSAETRQKLAAITRSTRPHIFVQHHQHPREKQKQRGNNRMTPKHEGHPKDCNDECNQCHPAEAFLVVRRHAHAASVADRPQNPHISTVVTIPPTRREFLTGAGAVLAVPRGAVATLIDDAMLLASLTADEARLVLNVMTNAPGITAERALAGLIAAGM